jgi:hypothetical protein
VPRALISRRVADVILRSSRTVTDYMKADSIRTVDGRSYALQAGSLRDVCLTEAQGAPYGPIEARRGVVASPTR